jgi:hypothetical protein
MTFKEFRRLEYQTVVHVEDSLGAVEHLCVGTPPLSFRLVHSVCIWEQILFRPCEICRF